VLRHIKYHLRSACASSSLVDVVIIFFPSSTVNKDTAASQTLLQLVWFYPYLTVLFVNRLQYLVDSNNLNNIPELHENTLHKSIATSLL